MALIHEKLIEWLNEIQAIQQDEENRQQGFKYRGIYATYNQMHRIAKKVGVITVPTVLDVKLEAAQTKSGGNLNYATITVRYDFMASDGSSVPVTTVGMGMDSGDKATNKALSAAHKYAFFQLFMIPTQEIDDGDKENQEQIPGNEQVEPRKPKPSPAAPAVKPKTLGESPEKLKQLHTLFTKLGVDPDAKHERINAWLTKIKAQPIASSKDIPFDLALRLIKNLQKQVDDTDARAWEGTPGQDPFPPEM